MNNEQNTKAPAAQSLVTIAITAASAWASAEYADAKSIGAGGPGCEWRVDEAKSAACAAIAAIASTAPASTSASVDTPEFQSLAEYWRGEPYGTRSFEAGWADLTAHIKAHCAAREVGAHRKGFNEGSERQAIIFSDAMAAQAAPTDISTRLRNWADTKAIASHYADAMRAGADEIERYHGAMLAWQQTAETRDRQLSEEKCARQNDRLAARAAARTAAPDVDQLANFIREVDGNHSMGAGTLAEKIVEWLEHHRVSAVGALTDAQIDEVWSGMPGGPAGWLKEFGYSQYARAILAAASKPAYTGAGPAMSATPIAYAVYGIGAGKHYLHSVHMYEEGWKGEDHGLGDYWAGNEALPSPFASRSTPAAQPALTVWCGSMPESNGKSNFTAILNRADAEGLHRFDGFTFARSEYPDRVRYEADCVRYLIGELSVGPLIFNYDADKHSGYVPPTLATPAPAAQPGELELLTELASTQRRVIGLQAQLNAAMLELGQCKAQPGERDAALVKIGQLVELQDGFKGSPNTIFCEWNEARYKLPAGTAIYADMSAPAQCARDAQLVTPQEAAAAGLECGDTACGGCNAGENSCMHAPVQDEKGGAA